MPLAKEDRRRTHSRTCNPCRCIFEPGRFNTETFSYAKRLKADMEDVRTGQYNLQNRNSKPDDVQKWLEPYKAVKTESHGRAST